MVGASERATLIRKSPRSTSISVRPVSLRMAARRRTKRASIGSAGALGSGMRDGTLLLLLGDSGRRQAAGGLDGELVTGRAEARDDAHGGARDIGMQAEVLPRGGV